MSKLDGTNSIVSKNSKNGDNPQNSGVKKVKQTKKQIEHALKIELMRYCVIFGKSYQDTSLYFKSKGYNLGTTQFTELRNELKSKHAAKDWFRKEALYAMEEDHMLSVDRIKVLEDRIMEEFEQVSATTFYKYINAGTDEQQIIRNKAHDGNFLLRLVAQFQSLQDTKTKLFSATPMVQEIMEVHAQQEEEENTFQTTPKQEKMINK